MKLSRLTIRARITGGSLVIAILISIVAGVVIYSQVQRIVADGQRTVLENIEGPYLTALGARGSEEIDPPGPGQLVAVISTAGEPQLDTLPQALSSMLDELVATGGTHAVEAGDETYLVRVSAVETSTGTWHVVSAIATDAETELMHEVALLLVGSIAVINIAFGAASWFIGSAALRPVGRLRRSAAELVTAGGTELLPEGPAQDELTELAHTLNQLIAELRASAERERQIVSDASHEFRTPLAILQTQLELAQRESSSLEQLQSDVTAARHTLARLSALATSMLELSRLDAGSAPGSATLEELAAEVADAADRGRLRVGERDIRIDFDVANFPAGLRVNVGHADFGRVCDNLINNALAVMESTGSIDLRLTADPSRAVLTVTDTGGGMPPEFVPHAFDRFSRADYARTGGGAGLGLSIVAGIVGAAGGSVRLDNRPGAGLAVRIDLPADSATGRPDNPDRPEARS